jgi:V8-like Glu-specific endopeptidase
MGLTWNLHTGYLNTAGYPGDKPSGTQWFASRQETDLWPFDKLFYSNIDVIPGQSGSPVWELRGDGTRYIKGVVSHQACNQLTADNRTCIGSGYNGLVQLDATHFRNVLAWR